jgi:hypothetical protein
MVTSVVTLWLSCIVADFAERLLGVAFVVRHCSLKALVVIGAVHVKREKYFNFLILI